MCEQLPYSYNNDTLSSAFAEYVTVFTVLQAYSTPAGQASGEKFSLPIKVPIYLPRMDERFGMPWRGLNSQHYDYKRVALPTELSRPTVIIIVNYFMTAIAVSATLPDSYNYHFQTVRVVADCFLTLNKIYIKS